MKKDLKEFDVVNSFQLHRPNIEKALKYAGTHTYEHLLLLVLNGTFQYFAGEKSFIVTEVQTFPLVKRLHIFVGGGNLQELQELEPRLDEFAKLAGCTEITGTGRFGWDKVKNSGWKKTHVVMKKEI